MAFGVRAVAGTRAHAAARHARDATALAGFFVAFAFCAVSGAVRQAAAELGRAARG